MSETSKPFGNLRSSRPADSSSAEPLSPADPLTPLDPLSLADAPSSFELLDSSNPANPLAFARPSAPSEPLKPSELSISASRSNPSDPSSPSAPSNPSDPSAPSPQASALLEARALSVKYGQRLSIDGVNLKTRRGELVGILGSPDAGKSTLFKTLCLLVSPNSGSVFFDGQELNQLRSKELSLQQARFGFAFQRLGLFDRKTALSNVAFPLLRRGLGREEARQLAGEALRSVGLAGSEQKLPHQLSGGMRRRLALARAMVTRPDVALLDDPFVGLDPVACARIADLIVRAHRENGGVTLVAAGDPAPLLGVADRLILMERGKLIVDLPSNEFTAAAHPAIASYMHGAPLR